MKEHDIFAIYCQYLWVLRIHCKYNGLYILSIQPCIIGIEDVIDTDDTLYIVLEL